MFEAMSDGPPLPGHVLQQHHRPLPRSSIERGADRVRDQAQGVFLRAGGARARMNDDAQQTERLGAIELVDKAAIDISRSGSKDVARLIR